MGPVDMSVFKLGDPIGVDGDVFRNYRYAPDRAVTRPSPIIPALAAYAAATGAARFPLSGGIINSPIAMGAQGFALGTALQKNDPDRQRQVANLLLTARAAALAESIRVGLNEANDSLLAITQTAVATPASAMFSARNLANYRATMTALKNSLLRGPARNLGALIAVGAARAILTDPANSED